MGTTQTAIVLPAQATKVPATVIGSVSKPLFSLCDICDVLGFEWAALMGEDTACSSQFFHRRIKRGQALYRMYDPFTVLYLVRFGWLKTVTRSPEGEERVLSFRTKGDILGLDGAYQNQYLTDVLALTDCDVIALPFNELLDLGHQYKNLRPMISMTISKTLLQERMENSQTATLKADARVALFLEGCALRYASLGFSPRSFQLPMTRRDIGSYLGLSFETVSRSLTALAHEGIILVSRRTIYILTPGKLHAFSQQNSRCATVARAATARESRQ